MLCAKQKQYRVFIMNDTQQGSMIMIEFKLLRQLKNEPYSSVQTYR